jgi:uridine phosphorylase
MSWPFETSEARITPQAVLDFICDRNGVTLVDVALPPTLVGTFQFRTDQRLRSRTNAAPLPIAIERPGLAMGITNSLGTLIGRTPRTGRQIAVALLPVGAPAAAMLLELAIARGVRNILICGSAGSLRSELPIGRVVVIDSAEREDGTSHHYLPAEEIVAADAELSSSLVSTARTLGHEAARGRSWTIDAPFRETLGAIERHQAEGITVVDMEAAAIFAVAKVRGVRAGIIVAVSDEVFRPWTPGFHSGEFQAAQDVVADAVVEVAEEL